MSTNEPCPNINQLTPEQDPRLTFSFSWQPPFFFILLPFLGVEVDDGDVTLFFGWLFVMGSWEVRKR